MIESLDISHLGVIESAHVDFGEGLIVVTGETGAGKTMVLSSLQLLLGARADAALVRSGADRLSVDGIFSVNDEVAARVEDAGGLVEGGELIVGRSVRAAGRSRAHLGSRPVPAAVLTDIVGSMVTIHGQSDQIRLTGKPHSAEHSISLAVRGTQLCLRNIAQHSVTRSMSSIAWIRCAAMRASALRSWRICEPLSSRSKSLILRSARKKTLFARQRA